VVTEAGWFQGLPGLFPFSKTAVKLDMDTTTKQAPMGPYQVLLSREELAARLDTSPDSIDRWRSRGDIPDPLRAGRWMRYDLWRVLRWLDGHRE